MDSVRICLAFLRTPRVFTTLLLGPMMIGLLLVLFQVTLNYTYHYTANVSPKKMRDKFDSRENGKSPLRSFLFQNGGQPLPPIKICRWRMHEGRELPLLGCEPKGYDIAIRTFNPEVYDPSPYVTFFDGSSEKLHICKTCSTSIVFDTTKSKVESHFYSPFALLIYFLAQTNDEAVNGFKLQALERQSMFRELQGTSLLHPPGYARAISISGLPHNMTIALNVSIFLAAALWLALKSHRKVLEYFGRNGALLPLVAACGKKQFYGAIWLITLVRLFFFLIPTLPLTAFLISKAISAKGFSATSLQGDPSYALLWIIAACVPLGCVTVLGSIADLKHRVPFLFIVYKYIPLLLCLMGMLIWTAGLTLGDFVILTVIRDIAGALPIIGLGSVLLAPVVHMSDNLLVIHALLSLFLALLVVSRNIRWFAAHLDEV